MRDKRSEILAQLARLQDNAKVILDLINEDQVMKKMESMRDSKALTKYLGEETEVGIPFELDSCTNPWSSDC